MRAALTGAYAGYRIYQGYNNLAPALMPAAKLVGQALGAIHTVRGTYKVYQFLRNRKRQNVGANIREVKLTHQGFNNPFVPESPSRSQGSQSQLPTQTASGIRRTHTEAFGDAPALDAVPQGNAVIRDIQPMRRMTGDAALRRFVTSLQRADVIKVRKGNREVAKAIRKLDARIERKCLSISSQGKSNATAIEGYTLSKFAPYALPLNLVGRGDQVHQKDGNHIRALGAVARIVIYLPLSNEHAFKMMLVRTNVHFPTAPTGADFINMLYGHTIWHPEHLPSIAMDHSKKITILDEQTYHHVVNMPGHQSNEHRVFQLQTNAKWDMIARDCQDGTSVTHWDSGVLYLLVFTDAGGTPYVYPEIQFFYTDS